MHRTCTRCTRLTLGAERPLGRLASPAAYKALSTSTQLHAEASSDNASPPATSRPTGPRIRFEGGPLTPRSPNTPPSGQILRRTAPPRDGQTPRGNGPPQGTLIRRTSASQGGRLLQRTGPPRQGGPPGQAGRPSGAQGKQRRRRTVENARARDDSDQPTEEELDQEVRRYIDPPANPTELIEYKPKPQDPLELQKDWPNTPLSAAGLSASVVQRIEWLARRLPHGYQTPGQLAEHFQKGNLTRFESEEEKQQVLKIASELATKRAGQLSERKGEEVAAEDMALSDLSSRDEKTMLVNQTIRGDFGELEKQRMPFLDSVMRNLRNNETYHKPEMDKFMTALQKLMPANTQRRQQQPAQSKA